MSCCLLPCNISNAHNNRLAQVVQEAGAPLSAFYRHISKGAWPFSTQDHGWPISDCTSEGFKAALGIAAVGRSAVLSGPQVGRVSAEFWFVYLNPKPSTLIDMYFGTYLGAL